MRNSIVRAFALGIITGGFVTAGTLFAAEAAADGVLDADESAYAASWAPDICNAITHWPTTRGLVKVASIIVGDGYTPDSAVDIINAAVMVECPQHWPLLVAVGREAREGLI